MNFHVVAMALLGLLALIFLIIGSSMVSSDSRKHKSCTQETTARVRELKEKQAGKPGKPGSIRYYPVFEYHANGQFIRDESKVGSDKPRYRAGDEVKIFFDPADRRTYYIPGNKSATVIGTVFTILGIIVALIAVGFGFLS